MTSTWEEMDGYLHMIEDEDQWEDGLKYPDKNQYCTLYNDVTIVKLTQGQVMTIDKDDLDLLSDHCFHAEVKPTEIRPVTNIGSGDNRGRIYIYRLIKERLEPDVKGMEVDHIDRNPLNNCRSNLRWCTRSQNTCNEGLRSTNKSGTKGVHWSERYQRWTTRITCKGIRSKDYTFSLNQYGSKEAALKAAILKRRELERSTGEIF